MFVPAGRHQESLAITVREIRRVRRRRGTPVLTISHPGPDGMESLFVYFAKPPPLPGTRGASPTPTLFTARGLERSAAALTLRQLNRLLRTEIEGWVRALREAGAGSG